MKGSPGGASFSGVAMGEDPSHPSRAIEGKNVQDPARNLAHCQSLDLKQRSCSELMGCAWQEKEGEGELTASRYSSSVTAKTRAGLPASCSLRTVQSYALRIALALASSWASWPVATSRRPS